MAQTEEFMFQDVAYRPTVYRTGVRASTQCSAVALSQRIKMSDHLQKFKIGQATKKSI